MAVKGTPKEGNYNVICAPSVSLDAPFVAHFDLGIIHVSKKIKIPSHTHSLHIYSFSFPPLHLLCLYLNCVF